MPIRGNRKKGFQPKEEPPRSSAASMSRSAYLRQSLDELENWSQQAALQGSWQACGKLKADAIRVKAELEEALAKEATPSDGMTDAELVALVQRAIASLPERHLEVVEDALAFRRGKPSTVSSQVEQ